MGKREKIEILMKRISNLIKIVKRMPVLSSQNKKILNLVKENKAFYNIYRGERLFIAANGPSIKNERLDLLKGEHVFTVNQMVRKTEFISLNPIANFWFDPAYFDDSMPEESKKEFQKLFRKTCEINDSIINFVPVSAYDYLNNNNLVTSRVKFIDSCLEFHDGYNANIDFSKSTVGFQNIVQFAIAMGIYMGFDEIYLLGVDSTGIITKINQVLNQSIEDCYMYNLGESGQKYVNSLLNYFSVEEQFAGWTRIFHLYKELYRYCTDRNIKLVNCSSQTIIEGIPRIPLERVIENAQSIQ